MPGHTDFANRWWMRFCLRPIAVAGFFVYVTSLCTLALQQIFPYPFLFLYFGAVMGSAWFGGAVAGFLSVLFSTVIVDFFFVPPFYSFHISRTAEPYFVSFILCAAVVSWVSAMRSRAERAIRDARDQLEERVKERTAELEQSNLELLESGRELRALTEAIPQQIWRATPEGIVDYCNVHLLSYTGRTTEEICAEEFFEIVHPEDLAHFRDAWSRAIRTRRALEGEWRIGGSDGRYRWFLIRALPQLNSTGTVNCWYGTHIDLEDWKRAELALVESQAQLAHVTRVMSMGEITASLAHEINQPLAAIVANAYACLGWLKLENMAKAQSTAEKIIRDGTQAGQIVERLRALFLKSDPQRTSESINRIIEDTIRILRDESIRRHVSLRTQLADGLPKVKVDRVQLQQALLNLALNGMDAMADLPAGRAQLILETRRHESGDIHVLVMDCGVGIAPGADTKIFDAFFTTKPEGLGMGLSISRTIVEAHDGKLWASARPEGGTVFQFTLPTEA